MPAHGASTATRRLSDVEAAFAYTHALARGTTQVTTQLTLRGTPEPARLADGARRWAVDLPVLRLRIEERGEELWFREGPGPVPGQIDARTAASPQSFDALLRQELNSVLPTGGPLWRLRLVADPWADATHVLFTRNHAISDGHSTGAVVRALLDRLCDAGGDFGDAGAVGEPAPDADRLTYRPPTTSSTRAAGLEPELEPEPEAVAFAENRVWNDRTADFVPVELTREASLRLRDWCRQQGVTVNQFFAAALAESFAEVTGQNLLRVHTAVSLRGRYGAVTAQPVRLPDVGCFINVVHAPVRVAGRDLAAHARAYGAATRDADAAWRPARRGHAAVRRAVERMAAARAAPGVCVTNVGVVDPALGPHVDRVTAFRTVVNRTAANYAVVLHLSTLHGTFSPTLAFGAPAVERALVEKTAAALQDRALRPSQGAPTGRPEPDPAGPGSGPRTPAVGGG